MGTGRRFGSGGRCGCARRALLGEVIQTGALQLDDILGEGPSFSSLSTMWRTQLMYTLPRPLGEQQGKDREE